MYRTHSVFIVNTCWNIAFPNANRFLASLPHLASGLNTSHRSLKSRIFSRKRVSFKIAVNNAMPQTMCLLSRPKRVEFWPILY